MSARPFVIAATAAVLIAGAATAQRPAVPGGRPGGGRGADSGATDTVGVPAIERIV